MHGDVSRTVGVEDIARERMTIPVFGTGEGSQGVGGEAFASLHDFRSFCSSVPAGIRSDERRKTKIAPRRKPFQHFHGEITL
jgi:hypothetical protein